MLSGLDPLIRWALKTTLRAHKALNRQCEPAAEDAAETVARVLLRLTLERLLSARSLEADWAPHLLPLGSLAANLRDGLSTAKDPFDFGTLEGDILGELHELFVGVGPIEGDRRLRVRGNQGAKKREGIYFTPPHLVRRMVSMSLGPALEDVLTRRDVEGLLGLRILDPACGSGIFLVEAYDALEKTLARLHGRDLFANERRDLLAQALHGYDLNETAIELATCQLFLRALRPGETPDLFPRPSLRVCDSLTSATMATSERFDFVLSNPPYRFAENADAAHRAAFAERYETAKGQYDYWSLFLERALKEWLKDEGRYVFVLPDSLMARRSTQTTRELLWREGPPDRLWHAGTVFQKIRIGEGERATISHRTTGVSVVVLSGRRGVTPSEVLSDSERSQEPVRVSYASLSQDPFKRFLVTLDSKEAWEAVAALSRESERLERFLIGPKIGRGEELGKKNLPRQPDPVHTIAVLGGKESLSPFHITSHRRYVEALSPTKMKFYRSGPKLLIAKTGSRLVAASDLSDGRLPFLQTVYALHVAEEHRDFLEGWLNTDTLNWMIASTITSYKRLLPQLTQQEIRALPVPRVSSQIRDDVAQRVRRARTRPPEEAIRTIEEIDRLILAGLPSVVSDAVTRMNRPCSNLEQDSPTGSPI